MFGKYFLVAVAALVGAAVFFGFPDLDIRLLGIGAHRNFLFHSAALVVVLYALTGARRRWAGSGSLLVDGIVMGCGVGLAAHLAADVFQSKSVVFPFVGTLAKGTSVDDRLWIAANALISVVVSVLTYKRVRRKLSPSPSSDRTR